MNSLLPLLIPVFSVMGGHFILGENISYLTIIGALFMIVGVAIVILHKPKIINSNIDI